MKKYKLSPVSTQFKEFLLYEDVKHEISDDLLSIYVWAYCDQDLFDLGKLFQQYIDKLK